MAKKNVLAGKRRQTGARATTKKASHAGRATRVSWLDERSQTPVIERNARQLGSFIEAMADGEVDASEVKKQEQRLVMLMKEIEPKLDNAMHEKITKLLCELTAYDLMQMLHSMQQAKPKAVFRG